MQTVNRVEIVISSGGLNALRAELRAAGIEAYTLIPDVAGAGDRGRRSADDASGAFGNSYVLTTCGEDELAPLIERLRSLLKTFGGACLVSKAELVKH